MGAAFLALGVFISSLTDNQGFAAGIGIAVILLNYYSVSLSEYVASTAFGSVAVLCVLIFVLGAVVRHLTKAENLAYGVSLVLLAAVAVTCFVDSTIFEGLLPSIMTKLSLFNRFHVFVNGVFDMTAILDKSSVFCYTITRGRYRLAIRKNIDFNSQPHPFETL